MSNIKLDMTDLPIWDYLSKKKGPKKWRVLCPEFSVAASSIWQSPIMLAKSQTQRENIKPLAFHYHLDTFVTRQANYTLQIDNETLNSYVVFNEETYRLENIHYHIPSEHFIEESQRDIEFHFVHRNQKDELLVVACLFSQQLTHKKILTDKFMAMPPIFGNRFVYNPQKLLPDNRNFFHYQGSLTTPPTIDQVKWFVFEETQPMTNRSLQRWRANTTSPITNRPTQPLNGRVISFCDCSD